MLNFLSLRQVSTLVNLTINNEVQSFQVGEVLAKCPPWSS